MKRLVAACLFFLVLSQARATDPSKLFRPVDGEVRKGRFVDIDPKIGKRLWVRYNAIADSGVELELTEGNKLLWRVYVEPLGVAHSVYQQNVDVRLDPQDGNKIDVSSVADGGNIFEMRSLKNGQCLSRRVTNKHSPIEIPADG